MMSLVAWRQRRDQARTTFGRRTGSLAAAVTRTVGADEAVLAAGLALIVVALWPLAGQTALLVPGAMLTWIALPPRAAFITRPPTSEKTAPRS